MFSFCVCPFFSNAQSSPSTTIRDVQSLDSGELRKGIPDGTWITYYENGQVQFIRNYSFDKWKQFQHEKNRYHPKRISMPITHLYHDNKKRAKKYIDAIHTFCAKKNCSETNVADHYHPPFENGLLHGPFANYHRDGTIKDTGNYKDGMPEGLWTKWTDDKQFYWKGFYKHGMKNREWKLYSSTDKLISIISFRNGKYLWRKDMKEGVEITQDDLSGF